MSISRRFKLCATQVFPLLRKIGSGHNGFLRIPSADLDQNIATIYRGEQSKIILTGCHSYGIYGIQIKSWGEGAHLYVGSYCSLGANLKVYLGGNHRTDWITTFPFGHMHNDTFPSGRDHAAEHPVSNGHVIIESDVWIGESTTIMSGIRVGSGSVIAANSVVVKDVEPYSVVGGNPARLIKPRFPKEIIEQLLDLQWWNYSDDRVNSIVPLLQQPPDSGTIKQIRDNLCR
jgi:acetyltransferase-like isoleucine patch superfamily enzyme